MTVRVMRDADLDAAAALSSAAFGVPVEAEQHVRRWRERVEHPMRTDPAGAFVAELDGRGGSPANSSGHSVSSRAPG